MATSNLLHPAIADSHELKLYQRIGHFLIEQRLDINPANYTFAYHVLNDPDGPLARAVAAMTDGGVRLTRNEIVSLGFDPGRGTPSNDVANDPAVPEPDACANNLVAQTQMQVEGFEDMVRWMQSETQDFGRSLAASADALQRTRDEGTERMLDEVARLTATMVERAHVAEARLEKANREASELRSKLEKAREDATRDPLTRLPNRRAFEQCFNRYRHEKREMLMAVCDIDHFKSVNDRFGHAVGDRVLRAIAHALETHCAGHFVARYGGEEFAMLFPDTDRAQALATLEEARVTVAAKRYRLRESDQPLGAVTFSAGITQVGPGDDCARAFERADALLYQAKNQGRNQITAEW